jgi:hypothetical protein
MNDDDDDFDPEDLTDDEAEQIVQAAVNELLNIAAGVAELQTTDAAAEEILTMCDLVAEYFDIERAEIETVENDDGSYTSRIISNSETAAPNTRTEPIPGVIRTAGRPKFRISDSNTRPTKDD